MGWLKGMPQGSCTASPMHPLAAVCTSGVIGRAVGHWARGQAASPLLPLTQVRTEGRMKGWWYPWQHEMLMWCCWGQGLMNRGRVLHGTALRKHPFSSKAQDHLRQGSAEAFYLQKASYNSETKLPNMRHCRHLQPSPDCL